MSTALFFLVLGFLITVVLTPWVIRLAHAGVGMDVPDSSRKSQATPVPRLGGMPIMVALSVGLSIILMRQSSVSGEWFPVFVGASLMYGLGMWDDVSALGAKKKLIGQIAVAGLAHWLGLTI